MLNKKLFNEIYRFFLENSKDKLKIKNGDEFIKIFGKS